MRSICFLAAALLASAPVLARPSQGLMFAASPMTKDAVDAFCANHDQTACSLFLPVAAQCERYGLEASSYFSVFALWRQKGLSVGQASYYASRYHNDPDLIDRAAAAPAGTTPAQFRMAVLQDCLTAAMN